MNTSLNIAKFRYYNANRFSSGFRDRLYQTYNVIKQEFISLKEEWNELYAAEKPLPDSDETQTP